MMGRTLYHCLSTDMMDYLQDPVYPFTIHLDDGHDIEAQRTLRIRAGKRLACCGTMNGSPVFIKLFTSGARARRYWQQEQAGYDVLQKLAIPLPRRLLITTAEQGKYLVLVYQMLQQAPSLLQCWPELDRDRQAVVMSELLSLMARLHQAGFIHNDPHLGNFLLQDTRLIPVDYADISDQHLNRAEYEYPENLALLIAQFKPAESALFLSMLDVYNRASGMELVAERFAPTIDMVRRQRWQRYQKKLFRSCTAHVVIHSARQRVICRREYDNEEMRNILASPESLFYLESSRVLKAGNSSTVIVAQSSQRPLLVKRYNIKSARHALMRAVQATRASRSWRNAHALIHHGIATAPPVAMVENRFGPLRNRAYYLQEFVNGPTLADLIRRQEGLDDELRDEVIQLVRQMHLAGISHGDLKASNFICSEQGIILIDLDSMQVHERDNRARRQAIEKDRQRFIRNWQDESQAQDILRQLQ